MLSLTSPRHTSTPRIPAGWSRRAPDIALAVVSRGWAKGTPTAVARQRPESAPKPPFDSGREIAFTALSQHSQPQGHTSSPRNNQPTDSSPNCAHGPLTVSAPSRRSQGAPRSRGSAARFGEVNAETIVEIRALRNEITHMHMIDAAIATERDETLWLN
jgi:hypothetical protein